MRIRELATFLIPPGWLFVRVRTDEGVTGWGEAGFSARPRATAGAVEDLAELVIGCDPLERERHWQTLTRAGFHRGGPVLGSAVGAIDEALWDIVGRIHEQPVHRLLGGPVRDRLRAYAWVGTDDGGDEPDALAADALAKIGAGYTAIKHTPVNPGPLGAPPAIDRVVAQVDALRTAVGPEVDIALDLHGRYDAVAAARLVRALEGHQLLWVEEPVLPDQPEAIARLAMRTSIPLAAGERCYSRSDVKPLLTSGLAVLQPDVSLAGGITEMVRIAAMCEPFGIALAPHCAIGPVTLAASVQLGFALPGVVIQERDVDWYDEFFRRYVRNVDVFDLHDGGFAIPTAAGLGLDLDEDAITRAAAAGAPAFRPPRLAHPDGSYAEW